MHKNRAIECHIFQKTFFRLFCWPVSELPLLFVLLLLLEKSVSWESSILRWKKERALASRECYVCVYSRVCGEPLLYYKYEICELYRTTLLSTISERKIWLQETVIHLGPSDFFLIKNERSTHKNTPKNNAKKYYNNNNNHKNSNNKNTIEVNEKIEQWYPNTILRVFFLWH